MSIADSAEKLRTPAALIAYHENRRLCAVSLNFLDWTGMNRYKYSSAAILFAAGLALSANAAAQTTPTFSKDIAPIFFRDCASCHRSGEIAPMSLLTYEQARPWAKSIKARVASGQMPPWQSDDPHGTFLNDRRLSDAEKSLIVRWVDVGAPQGNAKDMPPAPKFPEGWQIGKPDAVFSMEKPYEVPATGVVEIQASSWFRATSLKTSGYRQSKCVPARAAWCTTFWFMPRIRHIRARRRCLYCGSARYVQNGTRRRKVAAGSAAATPVDSRGRSTN